MEILVSLSHVLPDVVFEGEKPVRLLLNFGHKAEDIQAAVGDKLDDESLNRFVALWEDPNHPREFVPQGKNLIVKSSI
jgi:hypothetical protein